MIFVDIDTIKPVFDVSPDDERLIEEIEKKLDLINISDNLKNDNLRIKSRVRSVYSSLAIEDNSLPIESTLKIIQNKPVLGRKKEVQEVKNANELYENMKDYNFKSEKDFLKAHSIMMKYFDDDNGYYRNHGEGVKRGDEIIYRAPDSIIVPSLMKSLFSFVSSNDGKLHPLVLSAIFHYYFVYIHPFSDGNGRLARFWVSLILASYNPKFEYVPFEEEIYLNRDEYYSAIAQCHINGNANVFISFMLRIINSILDKI